MKNKLRTSAAACLLPLTILLAQAAYAQGAGNVANSPAVPQNPIPGSTGAPPGQANTMPDLFSQDRTALFGNWGGLRDWLSDAGVSFGVQETSEVFGNATGGIHHGADYDGLTSLSIGLDTEKAFGWQGGVFNISALQIHGRNLNADNLDNLQIPSGIEANRATRLWELWYQQSFAGGAADVRIGEQSIDNEFIVSQSAGQFINLAFGWPIVPSVDLYAGGPSYPLASPGVRFRATPAAGPVTFLAGVFDDNPPGGPFNNDSQTRGAAQSGAAFNTNTGALVIAEIQYGLNQPSASGASSGLPGTYKFGGWYDTGNFPNQSLADGTLALPRSVADAEPTMRRHDWSLYAVADQAVWRPDAKSPQTLNVFTRLMGAPGDRNLSDFVANAGFNLKAPFPGRDNDSFGIAYGLAHISSKASRADQAVASYAGSYPVRSSESLIEITYQAQLTGWWQIQPDFQYVWMPSGGILDPTNPIHRIGNEAIFGLRTNVIF